MIKTNKYDRPQNTADVGSLYRPFGIKRPAFAAASVVFISLIFAKYVGFKTALCVDAVLFVFTVLTAVLDKRRRFKTVYLFAVSVIAALSLFCIKYQTVYKPVLDFDQCEAQVTARLSELPSKARSGEWIYTFKTQKITCEGTELKNIKVLLFCENKPDISEDDIVSFSGIMHAENSKSPYIGNGIFARFYDSDIIKVGEKKTAGGIFLKMRRHAVSCISEKLDGDYAGIVCGVTVGGTDMISDKTYAAFKICGASHITSVSGLHASVLSAIILALLLSLGVHRKIAAAATLAAVTVFAGVSGFHYSTIRSVIMLAVMTLSVMLFESYDPLSALSAAVLAVCTADPFSTYNIGFLLSVTSVAGILILAPVITENANVLIGKIRISFVRRILYSASFCFAASVSCMIFNFPITVIYFGYVSLISPVSNLFLVFMAEILLIFSVISVTLSVFGFFSAVSSLFLFAAGCISAVMQKTAELFALFPFASAPMNGLSLAVWAVFVLIMLLIPALLKNKRLLKRISVIAASGIFLVYIVTSAIVNYNVIKVTALDSAYGICVVVSKGNNSVVIGTGNGYNYSNLYSFLLSERIETVDCLCLTDMTEKNSGGASSLITDMRVNRIVVPDGKIGDTEILCASDDSRIYEATEGLPYFSGYARIQKGENSVNITSNGIKIIVAERRYFCDDSSGKCDLLICSSEEIKGVSRKQADIAFVQNREQAIYKNSVKLLSKEIECRYTYEDGPLTAKINRFGKIKIS